jgi:hypothetical protein
MMAGVDVMAEEQAAKPRPWWVEIALGVIDIAKAAFWPALVLYAFMSLYGPIHTLIARLPDVVGRADVITLGELNVKLNKALAVEASPEVREGVSGLSSSAAVRLIEFSPGYTSINCVYHHDTQSFAAASAVDHQLEQRKLVTIIPSPEENGEDRSECYGVTATELGLDTKKFLVNVLTATLFLRTD